MTKNFRFWDFRLKIRFKLFWIDSDQKNFFDQNFLPLSFFRYFGHFGRKTTKSHEKNFTREKIFDFEIFVLKYVSKHSESIPKKIFWPKIFKNFHFLVIFWLKMKVFGHFRIFLGRNQKNVFCKPFAQFYYGHFKPSPRSLTSKLCKRLNFVWFLSKLDLPAPVTRTGGSKGKNSLVPLTSFVPVNGDPRIFSKP